MILIRAAVQICSRDFSALPDGYWPARPDRAPPGAFRKIRNGGLTFQGCRDSFLRIPASDQKQVAPENIAQ